MSASATARVPYRLALLGFVPALVWLGILVGVGFLVGGPATSVLGFEDGIVTGLKNGRTPMGDDVTHALSWTADTARIVGAAALVGLALRWVYGTWVEPLVLWAGVALQSAVFLSTTLLVDRERPTVEQLDEAPPTSSFPSGHTGASTALWLGLALVVASHVRSRRLRVAVAVLLLVVPVGVGISRLYRGMHHPSDVLFGVLNGGAAVLIARYAALHRVQDDAAPTSSASTASARTAS